MSRRYRDAAAIQDGACNPSGVARSLVNAINEVIEEDHALGKECVGTNAIKEDAACRAICHQLAHLMGVDAMNDSMGEYRKVMDEVWKLNEGIGK